MVSKNRRNNLCTQVHSKYVTWVTPRFLLKRFLLLDQLAAAAAAAAAVCINKSMSIRMANQMQELDWWYDRVVLQRGNLSTMF